MTTIVADVVLVDINDKELGKMDKLQAHKKPFPLHRAVSVVIFDPARIKMLVQQRSSLKPTWPLTWSNAVCTHPKPGESNIACAQRRLKEEIGFTTGLKEKFSFIYKRTYDSKYGENEFDHVFVGEFSGEVIMDAKEAANYQWITINELKKDIKSNPQKYTPWFIQITKKLNLKNI
jgi:isopentenyl-diphosphate delta-isomerase